MCVTCEAGWWWKDCDSDFSDARSIFFPQGKQLLSVCQFHSKSIKSGESTYTYARSIVSCRITYCIFIKFFTHTFIVWFSQVFHIFQYGKTTAWLCCTTQMILYSFIDMKYCHLSNGIIVPASCFFNDQASSQSLSLADYPVDLLSCSVNI